MKIVIAAFSDNDISTAVKHLLQKHFTHLRNLQCINMEVHSSVLFTSPVVKSIVAMMPEQ